MRNTPLRYISGVLKLCNFIFRQVKTVAHCSNRDWYSCSGVWNNHYHWDHGFFLQEM